MLPNHTVINSQTKTVNKLFGLTDAVLIKFKSALTASQMFFKATPLTDRGTSLGDAVSFRVLDELGAVVASSKIGDYNMTNATLTANTDFYLEVTSSIADIQIIIGHENWNSWIGFTETTINTTSAPVTIDSLINDALASVKTYIDSKDASVKVYADSLIAQLMQTTDLEAKIALLNQVNDILDGDAATAGFQLWEANVAKLNQVVADLAAETLARSNAITASQNALQTSINSKSTEINARIDSVVSSLNTEITAKTTTLNSGVTANFVAMKAKAAIIFAV